MPMLSVILHCDLDCFYAQVERERLSLPQDACIAVVQWSSALAVSYSARKYGITRMSTVADIRRMAGDRVTIVPVQTITNPSVHTPAPHPPDAPHNLHLTDVQAREKVSLARYRNASAKVFSAIADALSGYQAKIERASIDEAYIDVTTEVERRVTSATETRQWPADTVVVGDNLDLQSETDVRLAYGAEIAAEVRQNVFNKCRYTVSAGISVNKLLAKFASAKNKPNQQTLVPMPAVPGLMKHVPLRKLRGLGGKMGRQVEALGVGTAGEATALSMEALEKKLGRRKDAEFVYKCVRGIDESLVTERELPNSIIAAKSFKGETSLDTVEDQWLPLLAREVVERMAFDAEMNDRDPKTLTVTFRAKQLCNGGEIASASRCAAMPVTNDESRIAAIISLALKILRNVLTKEKKFGFPINFIALTASNFCERAKENESICNYFGRATNSKDLTKTEEQRSKVDEEAAYKRRLQERADRELALRLHREESSGSAPKRGGRTRAEATKGRKRQKVTVKRETLTMDTFFKSKSKQDGG